MSVLLPPPAYSRCLWNCWRGCFSVCCQIPPVRYIWKWTVSLQKRISLVQRQAVSLFFSSFFKKGKIKAVGSNSCHPTPQAQFHCLVDGSIFLSTYHQPWRLFRITPVAIRLNMEKVLVLSKPTVCSWSFFGALLLPNLCCRSHFS